MGYQTHVTNVDFCYVLMMVRGCGGLSLVDCISGGCDGVMSLVDWVSGGCDGVMSLVDWIQWWV